jgi:hypothetical protein
MIIDIWNIMVPLIMLGMVFGIVFGVISGFIKLGWQLAPYIVLFSLIVWMLN